MITENLHNARTYRDGSADKRSNILTTCNEVTAKTLLI